MNILEMTKMTNNSIVISFVKNEKNLVKAEYFDYGYSVNSLELSYALCLAMEISGDPIETLNDFSSVTQIKDGCNDVFKIIDHKDEVKSDIPTINIDFDKRIINFNVMDTMSKQQYSDEVVNSEKAFDKLPLSAFDYTSIPFDEGFDYLKSLENHLLNGELLVRNGDNTVFRFYTE